MHKKTNDVCYHCYGSCQQGTTTVLADGISQWSARFYYIIAVAVECCII